MESSHQLPLITEIAIDVGILKNKATEQCQDVDWLCLGSGRETRPFNTAGSSLQTAANMEQHLHERVRCFHFADWLSGSDLFQVFGALRSAELSGGASWATLAPFLADRASAKKDEGIIETIESGSDE
eukprot:s5747_g7.t1